MAICTFHSHFCSKRSAGSGSWFVMAMSWSSEERWSSVRALTSAVELAILRTWWEGSGVIAAQTCVDSAVVVCLAGSCLRLRRVRSISALWRDVFTAKVFQGPNSKSADNDRSMSNAFLIDRGFKA